MKNILGSLALSVSLFAVNSSYAASDFPLISGAADNADTFFQNHTWAEHQSIVMSEFEKLTPEQKATLKERVESRTIVPTQNPSEIAQEFITSYGDKAPSEILLSGIITGPNAVEAALITKEITAHYDIKNVTVVCDFPNVRWNSEEHLDYAGYSSAYFAKSNSELYQKILGDDVALNILETPGISGGGMKNFARAFKSVYKNDASQVLVAHNQELVLTNLERENVPTDHLVAAYSNVDPKVFSRFIGFFYKEKGISDTDIPLYLELDRVIAKAADEWRKTHP